MTIIEQDGIRVESATERDAVKALRAEQRKAREESKRVAASRALASERAKATGFGVLVRHLEKSVPCGWRLHTEGNEWFPRYEYVGGTSIVKTYRIECEGGYGSLELYRSRIVAALMNGAGYWTVLWMHDEETNEESCYAVGTCDGECCLEHLPNDVRPSNYAQSSKNIA